MRVTLAVDGDSLRAAAGRAVGVQATDPRFVGGCLRAAAAEPGQHRGEVDTGQIVGELSAGPGQRHTVTWGMNDKQDQTMGIVKASDRPSRPEAS